jgi:hypothetical protein
MTDIVYSGQATLEPDVSPLSAYTHVLSEQYDFVL